MDHDTTLVVVRSTNKRGPFLGFAYVAVFPPCVYMLEIWLQWYPCIWNMIIIAKYVRLPGRGKIPSTYHCSFSLETVTYLLIWSCSVFFKFHRLDKSSAPICIIISEICTCPTYSNMLVTLECRGCEWSRFCRRPKRGSQRCCPRAEYMDSTK